MPAQTERIRELREAAEPGTIPYISKSRVAKWVKCPEKFRWSYIESLKEPTTDPMRRGTRIHLTFERYYGNAEAYVRETGKFPTDLVELLPDFRLWADFTEPYITNFLTWEYQRMKYAPDPESWLPVEIEAEAWAEDPLGYGDEAIPWMGFADAILPASNFPEIIQNDGVVIIDFKTGKTPLDQYRDEGIYLEGEYYAMLFEDEYDVAAVAGYYPKNNDFIVSPLDDERRTFICEVVHEMQAVSGTNPDHLALNETPLCKWGTGKDEQCAFYDICSATWGEGLKHEDEFRELVQRGDSNGAIASHFGMSNGAVAYTKKKLGL